jgi:predicted DNA-binding transcriptional regulator AlpA
MVQLLQYPAQLLTTRQVLDLLQLRTPKSLRRLIRERGFPRASVRPGERRQLFRASLIDDWITRQERGATPSASACGDGRLG